MSKPDSTALQFDYCAGKLSLRAIGEKYGLSEGAIRKRAKAGKWLRLPAQKGTQKSTQKVRKGGTQKSTQNNSECVPVTVIKTECTSAQLTAQVTQQPGEFDISIYRLSDGHARFVVEYLKDQSRVNAYRRAGYKAQGDNAHREAGRIYRSPSVNRAIQDALRAQRARVMFDADALVQNLIDIATADPNEISQLRRVNCRHCWGVDGEYQWINDAEYDRACTKAAADGALAPTDDGGYGFTANDDPNADCLHCQGEGEEELFITDTRDLSGSARSLYAGAKMTKNGIEIILRNQDNALKTLAQVYGLLKPDNSLTAPPPIESNVTPEMTHETATDAYKKFLG